MDSRFLKQAQSQLRRAKARAAKLRRQLDLELREVSTLETLLEATNTKQIPAVSRPMTPRVLRRINAARDALRANGNPLAPEEIHRTVVAKLGQKEAGPKHRTIDLLRRHSDVFVAVVRGKWSLCEVYIPPPGERVFDSAEEDS